MNKKLIIATTTLVLLAAAAMPLCAQQSIDGVLASVERNNSTLKALRSSTDAQKLENRAEVSLPDLELGFNYLWGNPTAIGHRKDFNVSQSFDLATLSGMKGKVADSKNKLVEWEYRSSRMQLLLDAKLACLDVIYYNAMLAELAARHKQAAALAELHKKRLDSGEGNRIEYNKVVLDMSMIEGEVSRLSAERSAVLARLANLNGGEAVTISQTSYDAAALPADFELWYAQAEAKSPLLAYVRQEVEVSQKQLSLTKKQGLPSFSAGYMGEFEADQRYQGVTVGVSIPLWSNKKRVRQAKAAVVAAQARQADAKQQFYGNLKVLYDRASGLKKTAETYSTALRSTSNATLLKKALDEGEISLLDYLVEMRLYYDTVNQSLDAEREFQKAYAELSATEL